MCRRPNTWRVSSWPIFFALGFFFAAIAAAAAGAGAGAGAGADLMLDTFPFNAGTTASDALWMGLPIVTRAGRSYISRMAGSLLNAVGLPDLVTETLADYERLAVTLGQQPQRVASYKRYLAEHGRNSPLFDLPQIVRDIEAHFERLALAARAA